MCLHKDLDRNNLNGSDGNKDDINLNENEEDNKSNNNEHVQSINEA